MGKEIERKFLVNKQKWAALEKPESILYRQGYIFTKPGKSVRIRQTANKSYLTVKSEKTSITRLEFEYEIPNDEAKELLDEVCDAELQKRRYVIIYKKCKWEIDAFLKENAGLLTAEIELTSEQEEIELPPWIATEVTGDGRYYNANLVITPFNKW